MKAPRHTLLLIPHGRNRSRRLRFSTRRALGFALGGAVLLSLAGGSIATWLVNRDQGAELERMRRKNAYLRDVNQRFDRELESLDQRFVKIQNRTRELAILSGLDGLLQDSGDVETSRSPTEETEGGRPDRIGWLRREAEDLSRGAIRLEIRLDRLATVPSVRPAAGPIASYFGMRQDPLNGESAFHRGIDIAALAGSRVRAAGSGVVIRAGRRGGLGRSISIRHGPKLISIYGHLASLLVENGTLVRRGQPIATVGRSGRSTGYHLHFEVRRNGHPIDPLLHLYPPKFQLVSAAVARSGPHRAR